MLRQNPAGTSSDGRTPNQERGENLDIQRELNRLEEMLLDSPRVPLSRRTMVDEETFLDQLDLIRLSLPEAFQQAEAIVQQKDQILAQAEQYAQEIIETAEQRAAQILNETGILRQAEYEAQQLRNTVQQECEAAQQQTLAEIEQTRRQAQRELEDLRHQAIEEAEGIQRGADEYADKVLRDMEAQMSEMLRIVRNGRQQLKINQPESRAARPQQPPRQAPQGDRRPRGSAGQ